MKSKKPNWWSDLWKQKPNITNSWNKEKLSSLKNEIKTTPISTQKTELEPTLDKKENASENPSVSATNTTKPTTSSDAIETNDVIPYNFNLDDYRVIHIPSDGHAHCSQIARMNQEQILAWTKAVHNVIRGDAKMYIDYLNQQFADRKIPAGKSFTYIKKFNDGTWPITFTWLHDQKNIINPQTGNTIKEILMKSIKSSSTTSPHVREMFIDTEHKHRVTIVYGTGTIYTIETYTDAKWRRKKRKVPQNYTGLRCIDTLRGQWKNKTQDSPQFGKIPLDAYFNNPDAFRINDDTRNYTDLYLRSKAPIGFEGNRYKPKPLPWSNLPQLATVWDPATVTTIPPLKDADIKQQPTIAYTSEQTDNSPSDYVHYSTPETHTITEDNFAINNPSPSSEDNSNQEYDI